MNKIKTLKYIFSLMLVLCSGIAFAGPTMNTIYVQGYLRKSTGSAVTDGNYSMVFSIRSGATYFWTKTVSVAVSGGFFSQGLSGTSSAPYAGSIDSASLAAAAGSLAVNVQTIVDGNAVSFDVQASPVPLALLSDKANTVVASGVDTAALATGAVTDVKLASSGTMPAWDGSALTNITASAIVGTVPSASFPSTLPAADGSALTALNASNLGSGTIPSGRFPATLPALNGSALTSLTAANLTGALPAISGASLTNLTATQISGTLPTTTFPALTGDVTSSAGDVATSVVKIRGTAVNATSPSSAGQVLRYDGSTGYTPAFVGMQDLRSTITGASQLPTSCSNGSVLTWNSVGDVMACTAITAVGTVTSGTWNGSTVDVAHGGTGSTSLTANGVLLGNGASALGVTAVGASGTVLKGTGAAPSFGAVSLTADVSGVLPLANGGTGANLSATGGANQFLKQTSAGGVVTVAAVAAADISTALTTNTAFGSAATGAVTVGVAGQTLSMPATTIQPGAGATIAPSSGALSIAPAAGSTLTVGDGTGASATTIQSGTGNIVINPGTGAGTLTLGNTGAGTGAIALGTGTGAQTVSLGTGAAVKTVTLGSTNGASATTINSGTGNIVVDPGTGAGTLTLGNTGAGTGTIAIGTGTGTQTVNVGTGAGAKTVTVGSTTGAAATVIQSGTGGIKFGSTAVANTVGITRCQTNVAAATTLAVTGCTGLVSGGAGWICSCSFTGTTSGTVPAPGVNISSVMPGYSAAATATAANIFVTFSGTAAVTGTPAVSCICMK